MNIKQTKRIQRIQAKMAMYMANFYENGLTIYTEQLENCVMFQIAPTSARWFEESKTVLGYIGKLGGVKVNKSCSNISPVMINLLFKH